jgi:hypothetical protein
LRALCCIEPRVIFFPNPSGFIPLVFAHWPHFTLLVFV